MIHGARRVSGDGEGVGERGEAAVLLHSVLHERGCPTRVPLGPMNREDPVLQPVYVEDVGVGVREARARGGTVGESITWWARRG